jgi:hypothetical protein
VFAESRFLRKDPFDCTYHDAENCKYAHTLMEVMFHHKMYKTRMCKKYRAGLPCPFQEQCSHAHGVEELRFRYWSQPECRPSLTGSRASGPGR